MTTVTRPELDINTAIAVDGTIYLADAGFPVMVTSQTRRFDPVRIKLVQLPLPGGTQFDYIIYAWDTSLALVLMEWVDHIEQLEQGLRKMTLNNGEEIEYRASGNCGCGSRLGSFNPWPSNRMVGIAKPPVPWDRS